MTEYQVLSNRLGRIKQMQRLYIDCIDYLNAKSHNDYLYSKFCRAQTIAYIIAERMYNIIENNKIKIHKTDLGKSFDKLKETL